MEEKILREEFAQFRGQPVSLQLVQLPTKTFEIRFRMLGIPVTAPFKQESRAQAYFEYLKKNT